MKSSFPWISDLLNFLVILSLLLSSGNDAEAVTEDQIKAVFLFNFAQFVEWPPTAFQEPISPFVIGVFGDDPITPFLDEVSRGEKVNNRRLVIERYQQINQIKTCHILFLSVSRADDLDKILIALKNRSVLTVGAFEGFAKKGGMIRFVKENNKIRFRSNVDAAKASNLIISSKLLRPAQIVTTGQD